MNKLYQLRTESSHTVPIFMAGSWNALRWTGCTSSRVYDSLKERVLHGAILKRLNAVAAGRLFLCTGNVSRREAVPSFSLMRPPCWTFSSFALA